MACNNTRSDIIVVTVFLRRLQHTHMIHLRRKIFQRSKIEGLLLQLHPVKKYGKVVEMQCFGEGAVTSGNDFLLWFLRRVNKRIEKVLGFRIRKSAPKV
jgi:hypothetical protein